jgi:hypothetical protein
MHQSHLVFTAFLYVSTLPQQITSAANYVSSKLRQQQITLADQTEIDQMFFAAKLCGLTETDSSVVVGPASL